MNTEIDLSMFRQMCLSDEFMDVSADLTKFDNKGCTFYYDESNNIRKLWLNENDFNAPIDSDFVLGGVMSFSHSSPPDIDRLKKDLRLQQSAKEMKFKHISKSKDFIGCLSEKKVNLFLQWLHQSDLYVHYCNINNLYWAIIDIVESIEEHAYLHFTFQIKNELYKVARANYTDFYHLLVKYNYPNIAKENIKPFYRGIIDLIYNTSEELPFELEVLRQGLKGASKQHELIFLSGNEEKTIIDSYFIFYLRPIGLFPSAQHIFDNEYRIEEQFNKHILLNGSDKAENYRFVDSIDEQLVQVSDCIVGLLGKYYTYVNGINIQQAQKLFEELTPEQKQTLKLFAQIISKSEGVSKLLLNATESLEEHGIAAYILQQAL